MSEQNKMQARRLFEEVWSQGNVVVLEELVTNDYVGHSPPHEIHGPEGAKQFISVFRNAFPDIHFTVEDQIAEGDKAVIRWTARGTHKGEFQGIPPTGKQVVVTGIGIFRVANGKLVEGWTNADLLGILQQLGAIPAPKQSGR